MSLGPYSTEGNNQLTCEYVISTCSNGSKPPSTELRTCGAATAGQKTLKKFRDTLPMSLDAIKYLDLDHCFRPSTILKRTIWGGQKNGVE